MTETPALHHIARPCDWRFFAKYLALSREEQDRLGEMVDCLIKDRPTLPR